MLYRALPKQQTQNYYLEETAMDCVNLKKRFGDRFKVDNEQAYHAQYGPKARIEDPWYMILRCQRGHIYPHGGKTLAASTDRNGPVANRLVGLDCATVVQDGDDGVNVTFDVDDFGEVAEVMKPKRKRQGRALSDEEKKRLADQGRAALNKRRGATPQAPESDQERPPGGRPV
jgi:hypothetical protein